MTDAELLAKVKKGLGITGTYQDDTLNVYIDEVKAFMLSAGVKQTIISSEASVGCIMRGVADLWNYGSGNAELSPYFKQRLVQLTFKYEKVANPTFTPASGATFEESQSVEIACATTGATIYYTTDGSKPTKESSVYSGAITLTATTTIKAFADKANMTDSDVVTATYTKTEAEANNGI